MPVDTYALDGMHNRYSRDASVFMQLSLITRRPSCGCDFQSFAGLFLGVRWHECRAYDRLTMAWRHREQGAKVVTRRPHRRVTTVIIQCGG